MMRSVCFVDRVELEFSGNHFSHAITIGDVDNDGLNELLIGNVDGVLAIFKGERSTKAWKKCSGLGTVTCVGVGDIFNTGSNTAVVINAESQCHMFIIGNADKKSPPLVRMSSNSSSGSTSSPPDSTLSPVATPSTPPPLSSLSMRPVCTQTLQVANVKVMCFAQIAPEGQWDLCVGHTDRGVAVYRWHDDTRELKLIQKFSLSGQIGSLSIGRSADGVPQLLISQPGGTYVPLSHSKEKPKESLRSEFKFSSEGPVFSLGDMVGMAQRSNPTSSTEVVGDILSQSHHRPAEEDQSSCSNIVALSTLDGIVRLLRNKKKVWELQVDHSLFAIGKLDVTGSGSDEIIACAWDGTTYIVDHNRNYVRFCFNQNVSTFACGLYGISENRNVPCLVYTTFTNHIYVYHNIMLPAVPSANLLTTLQNKVMPEALAEKLKAMNNEQKQQFFQKCLYQYHHEERTLQRPQDTDVPTSAQKQP